MADGFGPAFPPGGHLESDLDELAGEVLDATWQSLSRPSGSAKP
jgi:hypothetical protein